MQNLSKLLLLPLFISLLFACTEEKKAGQGSGRFGMMDTNTPEYAATQFFQHIYDDKTLKHALTYTSERLGKRIKSYHTNRNVQRHVLNLTYDPHQVDIRPDSGNSVGRNEFAKTAVVTLFFTGLDHGEQKEDLRVLDMVREDAKWKVAEIRPDKYL